MYKRTLAEKLSKSFKKGFISLVYGPRRVGKTVLLEQVRELLGGTPILTFNGDTREATDALSINSEIRLRELVKNHEVIFIDEAQRIPNISLSLKILIDMFPEKKILVTGSSSLELARGVKEGLTGRNRPFMLFPLSTSELSADVPTFKTPALLQDQLVFGGYPHAWMLSTAEEKKQYLSNVVDDYLFRDAVLLERLEYPDNLRRIATLLAFQIGKEVSFTELANAVNMGVRAVARYIDLLEKTFVIFHIDAHSTNMRKEVSKGKKYYFYDLGIRNTLADQVQPLDRRTDVGELWENFLMVERMKRHSCAGEVVRMHFWRNYTGSEVDLVEIRDGAISAFEFKWGGGKPRTPGNFKEAYGAEATLVNRENYLDFLL